MISSSNKSDALSAGAKGRGSPVLGACLCALALLFAATAREGYAVTQGPAVAQAPAVAHAPAEAQARVAAQDPVAAQDQAAGGAAASSQNRAVAQPQGAGRVLASSRNEAVTQAQDERQTQDATHDPAAARDTALARDSLETQELPAPGIVPVGASSMAVSFMDGRPPLRVAVYERRGALYMPDSELSAAFGISVRWDPVLRLITMSGRKGEATAVVGGTAAMVGERVLNLPHPFLSEANRILVPISFLTLGLSSISNYSASLQEESGELLASSVDPTVSDVTLGGRPGLARVTVVTARPLAYRMSEGQDGLKLILKGAVPNSAFGVKGTAMSPLRDCIVSWSGQELTLTCTLGRAARAFQTYREEYPQAIVLVVSSAPYQEGYYLEPLSHSMGSWSRGRSVVLDPAHGGAEAGAVGEGGLLEKDVVLEICRKTASILRRRLGLNVHLTREGDHRVPPAGRAELANSRGAAVFVSVHCDSWPGVERRGYGAFVLPEAVVEGGYWKPQAGRSGAEGASDRTPGLLIKPWGKAHGRYETESLQLASAIVGEMARVHDGPAIGIGQVRLTSLAGVDAPAVAVRCGFLSNADDLRLLSSSDSRDRLAAAIARGIEVYLGDR